MKWRGRQAVTQSWVRMCAGHPLWVRGIWKSAKFQEHSWVFSGKDRVVPGGNALCYDLNALILKFLYPKYLLYSPKGNSKKSNFYTVGHSFVAHRTNIYWTLYYWKHSIVQGSPEKQGCTCAWRDVLSGAGPHDHGGWEVQTQEGQWQFQSESKGLRARREWCGIQAEPFVPAGRCLGREGILLFSLLVLSRPSVDWMRRRQHGRAICFTQSTNASVNLTQTCPGNV